jgi:hypothetical protein
VIGAVEPFARARFVTTQPVQRDILERPELTSDA